MTIGVRTDGSKELVALADGFRESTESWADLLRNCRRRSMTAPVLAVGDGALGFWKAVREVLPDTREQRCWFQKQASVAAALPKSRSRPSPSITAPSTPGRSPRLPTTQMCCWSSTSIPPSIEFTCARRIRSSLTFDTVRLRTRVTREPGSRAAAIAMAYKLIDAAQTRWRAVNAPPWSPWSVPAPCSTKATARTTRRHRTHRTRRINRNGVRLNVVSHRAGNTVCGAGLAL